jgi:CobQ-like glutamine amidotransferase family enzyme
MGAQKQKVIRALETRTYTDDIAVAIDVLNIALEDVLYDFMTLGEDQDSLQEIVSNKLSAAVHRLKLDSRTPVVK